MNVLMQAGDALFIPAGWWHQVDSDDVTIAVNFWWRPPGSAALQGGHAAFLLRESLRSLTQAHMAGMLAGVHPLPGFHAAANSAADHVLDQPDSQTAVEHSSGASRPEDGRLATQDSPQHAAESHGSCGCMHSDTGALLEANHSCALAAAASHRPGGELPATKKQRLDNLRDGGAPQQDEASLALLLAPLQSVAESEQLLQILSACTARSRYQVPAHQQGSQQHEPQPGEKQRHSLNGPAMRAPYAAFVMARIAQLAVEPDAGKNETRHCFSPVVLGPATVEHQKRTIQHTREVVCLCLRICSMHNITRAFRQRA